MSLKRKIHNLKQITSDLDRLIVNLEILLKEIRPRTNVRNSRIGYIRRDLDKIFELDTPEIKNSSSLLSN